MSRFSRHVTAAELESDFVVDGPDPSQVLDGDPVTATAELDVSPDGTVVRGLWRVTAGTVTDVEADEMFVVLSGSATVAFTSGDRSGEVWDLGPGSVGIFIGGESTTWTVTETLTKAFQITDTGAESAGAADSAGQLRS